MTMNSVSAYQFVTHLNQIPLWLPYNAPSLTYSY
jgi:hypothetical protein